MDRYAVWLDHLPEEQRQRLAAAPPAERLRVIRELREQQLLDRLPQPQRDRFKGLGPEQRAAALNQLRKEERDNIRRWQQLARPGKVPASTKELPQEVQKHLEANLLPRLGPEEIRRLQAADGKSDQLLRLIADLAERHPLFPPRPSGPITRFEQLPPGMQKLLNRINTTRPGKWALLKSKEGKWPEFALACIEQVPPGRRADLPPLGASRPAEFAKPVQAVIATLEEKYPHDAVILREAEGHWPDYPQRLLELARKNKLDVPGMSLPGPRELWEHR
jgi:hypothetical protein